ncbi:unnamed protein product [Didymodactylos carnosus]|uniref:Potassium channel domain-containing protein n=1 Tax=Didymodactylos carnosus TaxID=1234261 RepID=A0A813PI90_9BILA|nr:unnamed protein product [Didymodactylos carnosus]CAF3533871.1 unnamed protein product [Didymodactylos carnosus]
MTNSVKQQIDFEQHLVQEDVNLFDNTLIINLLGKKYRIPTVYIDQYPNTLLGDKLSLACYYRPESNDYYFDRNPLLFQYIFSYYTLQQKIYCPYDIPLDLILNEIDYFHLHDYILCHEIITSISGYKHFYILDENIKSKLTKLFDIIMFIVGILFIISLNTDYIVTLPNISFYPDHSLSFSYIVDLIGTILLSFYIIYHIIISNDHEKLFSNKLFLIHICSTLLSIFILSNRNITLMSSKRHIYSIFMLLKAIRLTILIPYFYLLRLMILSFYYKLREIITLVFISILLTGTLSQIAYAFERREEKPIMKTNSEAFWWGTSLCYTVGYGDISMPLTLVGRLCGYLLTFIGLLSNGLVLQELAKSYIKISRNA